MANRETIECLANTLNVILIDALNSHNHQVTLIDLNVTRNHTTTGGKRQRNN